MIGSVHQCYPRVWMTKTLAEGKTAKPAAQHDHMGLVFRHADNLKQSVENAIRAKTPSIQ
jgi:hypothetical protein